MPALALAVFIMTFFLTLPDFVPHVDAAGNNVDLNLQNGMSVCTQTLGGTWITPTCYTSSPYTVNTGDNLQIESGVTLAAQTGRFTNDGTVVVLGSLYDAPDGVMSNSGTISVNSGGAFDLFISSYCNNTNLISINTGGAFMNQGGSLDNWGTVAIQGSLLNNFGSVENEGSLASRSGSVAVLGLLRNGATFNNYANLTIASGGTLLDVATGFTNFGLISNNGNFTTAPNSGFINSAGSIRNEANWYIKENSLMTNNAAVTNDANGNVYVSKDATINNGGEFDNLGTLWNAGALNDNLNPDPASPPGRIDNAGGLYDNGTILQTATSTFRNAGILSLTSGGSFSMQNSQVFKSVGIGNDFTPWSINLKSGHVNINAGGTLSVSGYGSLLNMGAVSVFENGKLDLTTSIDVYGSVVGPGAFSFVSNGTINNNGILNSACNLITSGSISNRGNITIYSSHYFFNAGSILNYEGGAIEMSNSLGSPTFWNRGPLDSGSNVFSLMGASGSGELANYGLIQMDSAGAGFFNNNTVSNYGRFVVNSGTIENQKEFTNFESGTFSLTSSYSELLNGGLFATQGNFQNNGRLVNILQFHIVGGNFLNTALVNNTRYGFLEISSAANFKNFGSIVNSGTILNRANKSLNAEFINVKNGMIYNGGGNLTNDGYLSNSGTISIDTSGSLSNYGTLFNNGTISDTGSFANICEGVAGQVTGGSPSRSPCDSPSFTTESGQEFSSSTPTINGTADANAMIQLSEGGVVLGHATADSDGNWSITTSALAPGTHTISAQAAGINGNSSLTSIKIVVSGASTRTTTAESTQSQTSTSVTRGEGPEYQFELLGGILLVGVILGGYVLVRSRSSKKP